MKCSTSSASFCAGLIATPVDTDSTACFPFVVESLDGRKFEFQTRSLEKRAEWLSWLRAASARFEMPDKTQPGAIQLISRDRPVGEEVSAGAGSGMTPQNKTRWSTTTHQFYHSASFTGDLHTEPYDASTPGFSAVESFPVGREEETDVRNTFCKLEML